MANVLDVLRVDKDLKKIQELADDLDGILSRIAYDEKASDIEYIKQSQDQIKKRYGKRVEALREGTTGVALCNLTKGISCVLDAYAGLQGIIQVGHWDNARDNEISIREAAEEILYENLLFREN